MKNQIPLFLFVLILLVPSARAQTPGRVSWNMYTVKDEDLSIMLPARPALQTFKDTGFSQKQRKRNLLSCSVKGVVYSIQTIENIKPQLTLEAFAQQQARSYSSDNLTFERDLTVDGIAGKEFVYRDKKGMVQFFVNDKRLYEIRAYGAPIDDQRIATFFQYFSFKKQAGAIQVSEGVQAETSDTTLEKIISSKQADTKVIFISKPEPNYTGKARNENIVGTIVLKCVFAADGTVTHIQVVQGLPHGLTEQAIAAARRIKFIPATRDGRNVSMWMQLEYTFDLNR